MESVIVRNPIFEAALQAKRKAERKVSATYTAWQKVSTIKKQDKAAWQKFMDASQQDIEATEYFESVKHLEFVK